MDDNFKSLKSTLYALFIVFITTCYLYTVYEPVSIYQKAKKQIEELFKLKIDNEQFKKIKNFTEINDELKKIHSEIEYIYFKDNKKLSIKNKLINLSNILDALCQINPENKNYYINSEYFKKLLNELKTQVSSNAYKEELKTIIANAEFYNIYRNPSQESITFFIPVKFFQQIKPYSINGTIEFKDIFSKDTMNKIEKSRIIITSENKAMSPVEIRKKIKYISSYFEKYKNKIQQDLQKDIIKLIKKNFKTQISDVESKIKIILNKPDSELENKTVLINNEIAILKLNIKNNLSNRDINNVTDTLLPFTFERTSIYNNATYVEIKKRYSVEAASIMNSSFKKENIFPMQDLNILNVDKILKQIGDFNHQLSANVILDAEIKTSEEKVSILGIQMNAPFALSLSTFLILILIFYSIKLYQHITILCGKKIKNDEFQALKNTFLYSAIIRSTKKKSYKFYSFLAIFMVLFFPLMFPFIKIMKESSFKDLLQCNVTFFIILCSSLFVNLIFFTSLLIIKLKRGNKMGKIN